ncbi:DUF6088 family protein [Bermanella sp. R86510]|uniref:DUF6088 family protein n=1 Tax=unclassified Bermanella TaxID=2627862 RepID=UPI0037C9ADD8
MSSYIDRIRLFVDQSVSPIILRNELPDICSRSQMNRLIKQACDDGLLIRVSKGVYVKARQSRITGLPVPAVAGGFSQLVRLVLARLDIEYVESEPWFEYQLGISKQIPANSMLYVPKSCSRQIEFGVMKANLIRKSRKEIEQIKRKYSTLISENHYFRTL